MISECNARLHARATEYEFNAHGNIVSGRTVASYKGDVGWNGERTANLMGNPVCARLAWERASVARISAQAQTKKEHGQGTTDKAHF
jgi:hypothetical protein